MVTSRAMVLCHSTSPVLYSLYMYLYCSLTLIPVKESGSGMIDGIPLPEGSAPHKIKLQIKSNIKTMGSSSVQVEPKNLTESYSQKESYYSTNQSILNISSCSDCETCFTFEILKSSEHEKPLKL